MFDFTTLDGHKGLVYPLAQKLRDEHERDGGAHADDDGRNEMPPEHERHLGDTPYGVRTAGAADGDAGARAPALTRGARALWACKCGARRLPRRWMGQRYRVSSLRRGAGSRRNISLQCLSIRLTQTVRSISLSLSLFYGDSMRDSSMFEMRGASQRVNRARRSASASNPC